MPVDTGIGSTLREARNRRKIELSEAESATKIRLRYLRAMENEQWDVLPGGAYTRAFIRTYASYLGLDGERLADEFRRQSGPSPVERMARVEATAGVERGRSGNWGLGIAAAVVLLAALLIGIGLTGGEEDEPRSEPASKQAERPGGEGRRQAGGAADRVTLELAAVGEVWVCLLDASGEELVDGQIMLPGEEQGPFRAKGFSAAFGNGEVRMVIDGRPAELPPSSSPVGYEIGASGEPRPLEEGERPDCE